MKHIAASSLLTALALGAALAAPAVAHDPVGRDPGGQERVAPERVAQERAAQIVRHRDAAGDVRLLRNGGLSVAHRRSVDLRRVVVARNDARVRFTVEVKKVVRRPRFDQMFFFTIRPPARSTEEWSGQVGFTSKGRYGYAGWGPLEDGDYASCALNRVSIRWARQAVSLDVPPRCVPRGELRLEVDSYTGTFRSDADPWSRDRARVPGTHVLRD